MITDIITLSAERHTTLELFVIENSPEFQNGRKRPAVLICPGGGYAYLSDREAAPIALRYAAMGFHAFVLRYGINEFAVAPGPLKDIAGAMKLIKDHSDEWRVDKDAVFVSGFSAGAHVAAQLGVFYDNKELLPEYADDTESIRPAGMILGYPVLDLTETVTKIDLGMQPGMTPEEFKFDQKHPKMPLDKMFVFDEKENRYFVNFRAAMNAYIFDGPYTDEQEQFYSLNNHIKSTTPPTFIWHVSGDGLIYTANSLKFALKLYECGVDYELHIYEGGQHGIALADYVTANDWSQFYEPAAGWHALSVDWINRLTGFKETVKKACV